MSEEPARPREDGAPGDATGEDAPTLDPRDIGSVDAPPVDEQPYKLVFEANKCIGAGHCAAKSDNWSLDLSTGIARPTSYFRTEEELDDALAAAAACPAKRGIGVIHVVDRRTGEELAPDPNGDGSLSVDW